MSIYLHKSHNVTILLYHLVCVAKYRSVVFDKEVDEKLKEICLALGKMYEIHFLEIGTDLDHVHFLMQSVPMRSPTKIVRTIKSIVAREMFAWRPQLREALLGAEFWSDGYFINTVSKNGSENTVKNYVKQQGSQQSYTLLHKDQLKLFV